MKRIVTAAVAALVLTGSLAGLAGCGAGSSVDELIRDDVASELELIGEDAAASTDAIAANMGQELDALGVDAKAFAQAYTDGYSYSIDAVDVDEEAGTATARVSMSCKSMAKILADFKTAFTDKVNSLDLNGMTQDDLYKLGGETLMDVVAKAEPEKKTLDLVYAKGEDGEWRADESAATELMDALKG